MPFLFYFFRNGKAICSAGSDWKENGDMYIPASVTHTGRFFSCPFFQVLYSLSKHIEETEKY